MSAINIFAPVGSRKYLYKLSLSAICLRGYSRALHVRGGEGGGEANQRHT